MSSKRKGKVNSSVVASTISNHTGYSTLIENKSDTAAKVMKQKESEKNPIQPSVYSNPRFMHVVTALTGNTAQVHTRDGEIYEGIFSTFSPNFDVALSAAHKVGRNSEVENRVLIDTFSEEGIVFKSVDVIEIRMKDVDLEYAVKDTFATDSAISAARLNGGESFERELEPWVGDGNDTDLGLESANGWDADEMFKRNEAIYGVTSTFKQNLDGYTVPLNVRDSADYKEMEARAARVEREIISSTTYDMSLELDNIDEEDKYSAVTRPGEQRSGGRSVSPQSNASSGSVGKYIPPNKRKSAAGKPSRPSQHNVPPRHQGNFQHQQSFDSDRERNDRERSDREPQPQRYPPRGRVSPNQPAANHNAQQRSGPPPGQQNRVMSPKNNGQPQPPTPTQVYGAPAQQQARTQVPPQQSSPAGYYKQSPTGTYTTAALRGPPEPVHVNGDTKAVRPTGPAPSPQVLVMQGTPIVRVQGKQIQQKPRDDQIAELKKFGQDFRLAEPNSLPSPSGERRVTPPSQPIQTAAGVHPTHLPPPNMGQLQHMAANLEEVSVGQASPITPMATTQPIAASPSPSSEESDKSLSEEKDVDNLSSSLKISKLNPNAKEFVFNPAAKTFTPRSPGAPTPPRSMTPQQAQMSVIPTGPLSAQGMSIMQSMPVVLGTPYYPSVSGPGGQVAMPMHSPVVPQQPYGPSPRAFRPRAVQVASSQVASVTGQPLLAPGPMPSHPFTVQYTPQGLMTSQGALMAGSSQHFPQFSQMPSLLVNNHKHNSNYPFQLYPIRLMTPQGGMMSLVATSGSYGDSPHSNQGPVYMTTVPTPAQTPGGSNGQGPHLYQPPTQSPALVNPPPQKFSLQGTPTGAPPHPQQHHVIYTPQPTSVTPGGGPPPHTPGPPPGAPHHPAAFPMVFIPPGHQGVTHMLPFQQGPNGVMGMLPQFHYIQAPVSSGQQQQHMVQQNQ